MTTFMNIADLVDPDDTQGRTYRQVNAKKTHAIPVGALVEIQYGVRLFVIAHNRDCDMTPLYALSPYCPDEDAWRAKSLGFYYGKRLSGYSEDALTVIDPQPDTSGWDE